MYIERHVFGRSLWCVSEIEVFTGGAIIMNENGNVNDEMIEKIEEAAERGAERGAKRAGRKGSIISAGISIVLILAVLVVGYYIYNTIVETFSLDNLLAIEDELKNHDLTIEDNGIFGYTAADFADAILGKNEQMKKLEVYETEISDAATITDTGLANLKMFTKSQIITYNGYATYTVDLSDIDNDSISFDEDNKEITLLIPHAKLEKINIPSEEIEFGDTSKGLLAWGDIKMTAEASAEVQTTAKEKMKKKLEETNQQESADRFAKLSVWEIYQPVVTGVSSDYKLEVDFAD